ncbi:hypothetical protein Poly41_22330 [Novipirellula artificiosorum]|uniref:Uncharacterized protein n=1 Tax=Novipirellula artificiosorum TaxID=2528016 RepID=A0A5C6DX68_9BACT|nr:hypothetical protein Poly41_22330 [Novipirellula artificiosorum]
MIVVIARRLRSTNRFDSTFNIRRHIYTIKVIGVMSVREQMSMPTMNMSMRILIDSHLLRLARTTIDPGSVRMMSATTQHRMNGKRNQR